jgi:hypothetical protein
MLTACPISGISEVTDHDLQPFSTFPAITLDAVDEVDGGRQRARSLRHAKRDRLGQFPVRPAERQLEMMFSHDPMARDCEILVDEERSRIPGTVRLQSLELADEGRRYLLQRQSRIDDERRTEIVVARRLLDDAFETF